MREGAGDKRSADKGTESAKLRIRITSSERKFQQIRARINVVTGGGVTSKNRLDIVLVF